MADKHFNTYKEGLDLEFVWQYCQKHGTVRTLERGEALENIGQQAQWVAYVEQGCFKYIVHNASEGKDYCTGFAFAGEFVANFPYCLTGEISELTIEADIPSKVRVISGQEVQALFDSSEEMARKNIHILSNLFKMVYDRYLDLYRYTPRERYEQLVSRCPKVVHQLSLKDIASFLNITPTYLSKIRRELTFSE